MLGVCEKIRVERTDMTLVGMGTQITTTYAGHVATVHTAETVDGSLAFAQRE